MSGWILWSIDHEGAVTTQDLVSREHYDFRHTFSSLFRLSSVIGFSVSGVFRSSRRRELKTLTRRTALGIRAFSAEGSLSAGSLPLSL